jgi:hypothetical protein
VVGIGIPHGNGAVFFTRHELTPAKKNIVANLDLKRLQNLHRYWQFIWDTLRWPSLHLGCRHRNLVRMFKEKHPMASAKSTSSRDSAVGVFHTASSAQAALHELRRAGFRDDQIGVVSPGHEGANGTKAKDTGSHMAEGAGIGVAAGAGVGALWALGIVAGFLPAIGPAVAGGIFASVLASAAGGAAIAGIAGALVGLGIPEHEAAYYEGEVKSGRTLVTVKTEGRYDAAYAILRRHNAYDYQNRSATGMAHASGR